MKLKFKKEDVVGVNGCSIEFKIGSKITVNNNLFKIVEQEGKKRCGGCACNTANIACSAFNCRADLRKDGKNIIVAKDE